MVKRSGGLAWLMRPSRSYGSAGTAPRFRLALPKGDFKPVLLVDAGFASAPNLALLRESGHSYLINSTRCKKSLRAFKVAVIRREI